jgi:hypothetical protein
VRLARKAEARILDFDVECRPLSWYGGDWVSKDVTAIAWAWVSPRDPAKTLGPVECVLLEGELAGFDLDYQAREMLWLFRQAYDQADVVTGHYVRGFDLPLLNGMALELGEPMLGPTLVQDTKLDLVRVHGLSKSQENLGALLGLRHPKIGMTQSAWRAANRLDGPGLEMTHKRVTGDVRQHVELRAALLSRGMLAPPRRWDGGARPEGRYHP